MKTSQPEATGQDCGREATDEIQQNKNNIYIYIYHPTMSYPGQVQRWSVIIRQLDSKFHANHRLNLGVFGFSKPMTSSYVHIRKVRNVTSIAHKLRK